MVLYTDAEMTATQSSTVAANKRRSFWRKLIANPPGGGDRRAVNPPAPDLQTPDPPAADLPAKDWQAKIPYCSSLRADPVPSLARAHSQRSPPANRKAG